ncbi:hypothetical protein MMC21_005239 [Puttea exsequens]|nr:hypothetical protein [Puttea exsequens]
MRLRTNPIFHNVRPLRAYPRPLQAYPRTSVPSAYTQQQRLYAGSNYGGGEGDPKGEDPQSQGPNPSASKEHPGPPPPDVGKGTGGGPTKKGAEGHNTQSSPSNSGDKSGGSGGPQPKIHKHDAPEEHHHSDDVKAHNKDLGKRHDRPTERSPDEEDKVDKGFWKGRIPTSANGGLHLLKIPRTRRRR